MAVAAASHDHMLSKVEQELDARTVGDQRRCQPRRRDIECRVPRMVKPRRMCEPVFSCNLQK
ncbi:Hypothetical protein RAK1035_2176 [Roseovarius sp. AK1035]|nr:Hypothetical protein RAK1035_2176 [Roseovarius sp. AK1035]